jgi:hypothetical protein
VTEALEQRLMLDLARGPVPALGFGYRAELDSFAIDVSFLNFQFSTTNTASSSRGTAQSLLKLSGLYFLSPTANRSAYVGGGLSFGRQSFGGSYDLATRYYTSAWEVTVCRAS